MTGSCSRGVASKAEIEELAKSTVTDRDDGWKSLERSVSLYRSWRQCYSGLVYGILVYGTHGSKGSGFGDGTWPAYRLDTLGCLKQLYCYKFVNNSLHLFITDKNITRVHCTRSLWRSSSCDADNSAKKSTRMQLVGVDMFVPYIAHIYIVSLSICVRRR